MSTPAFHHHPAWLEWGWSDPAFRPVAPDVDPPAQPAVAGIAAEMDIPEAPHGHSLWLWWFHHREHAAERRSMRMIPDHLRHDLGLTGSLPMAHFENGGRTFVTGDHPDSTLSGWFW